MANAQYIDFHRIIFKAGNKDSDDCFVGLDGADVEELDVVLNLRIKNKAKAKIGWTYNNQPI